MDEKIFDKISPKDNERLIKMVLEKPIQAVWELRNMTGCSLSEGLMWLDKIREKIRQENLPHCPYCGEKLRTSLAKQCRFCLRNWHDENDAKYLK